MNPWELLASATVPGTAQQITLHRRGHEWLIKVGGHVLMDNMRHASEDALAELACARIRDVRRPNVLIGGLGMGFTLKAALKSLGPSARVTVAELVPEVVDWNRGPIKHLAGFPLKDERVTVVVRDVAAVLRDSPGAFDAILQDVDNGPQGLTLQDNDRIYSDDGLAASAAALRPGGVLAYWASRPDRRFVKRLRKAGFDVDELDVRAHGQRGAHYTVWLAKPRPVRD